MAGSDLGAEIEDVRRRDPRLRQPPDQQQLPQVPGVGPVGLGSLLLALQRRRLGRLSQMHLGADLLELLDHEPPASRCLQPDLQRLTAETGQELPDAGAVRRHDPRTRYLAGHGVDPFGRNLRSMLIQTHHHRHATTSPQTPSPPRTPAREQGSARPITYREPRSVPPVRMAGRAAAIHARLRRRSTRRTGHLHHPQVTHAKRDITSFVSDGAPAAL
jgi:hypothetical protein